MESRWKLHKHPADDHQHQAYPIGNAIGGFSSGTVLLTVLDGYNAALFNEGRGWKASTDNLQRQAYPHGNAIGGFSSGTVLLTVLDGYNHREHTSAGAGAGRAQHLLSTPESAANGDTR